MVTTLQGLPPELQNHIASYLEGDEEAKDLSVFSRCNKYFHSLLTPTLYHRQFTAYSVNRPLQHAAFYGNVATLKRVVQLGIPLTSYRDLLKEATWMGHTDVVKFIVESGEFDIEERYYCGRTPLINTAAKNRTAALQVLLDHGASLNDTDPSRQTNRALFEAIDSHEGRDEPEGRTAAKLLIKAGMDLQALDPHRGRCALHLAAECGDVELIRLLLDHGADVNDPMYQVNHGLIGAACQSDSQFEITKMLLEAGAPFDDEKMPFVLIDAARDGKMDMVKLLIQYGADVNRMEDMNAPITEAVLSSQVETLRLLIKHGADVNVRSDFYERTPLIDALHRHFNENDPNGPVMAMILLEAGADISYCDKDQRTALHLVPPPQVASILLSKGAKVDTVDSFNQTPLSIAVNEENIDTVRLLLVHGADPNHLANSTPMLHSAISDGNEGIAKLLFQYGADPDAVDEYGINALQLAAQANYKELLELIMRSDTDINQSGKSGWSALMFAADAGHTDMVSLLLDKGADPDQAEDGWSPLMMTAQNGHIDTLNLLLDRGVNIDQVDSDGRCPLIVAAECRRGDSIEALLARGAKPAVQNLSGRTVFSIASEMGMVDTIKRLHALSQIDINQQDKFGRSALHYAAMRGKDACVAFLLSLDPPPKTTTKDFWGATPLILAIRNGHADIVEKLAESNPLLEKDVLGHDAFEWAAGRGNILEILHAKVDGEDMKQKEGACAVIDFNPDVCFCDVCGRNSTCQPDFSPMKCQMCQLCQLISEELLICQFCIGKGAKCLGTDHEWVPHVCNCGENEDSDSDENRDDEDDDDDDDPSDWDESENESNDGSDQESDFVSENGS